MKKLLTAILLAAVLSLPLGTVALADEVEQPMPAEASESYLPGQAPAQTSNADAMAPALHAILLAMESQGLDSFDAGDDAVNWEMLYNLLSMYGQLDDRSYYEGDILILPSETVYDYSAALFNRIPDPAQMPESIADRMTYDPETDEFRLVCGSEGLSQIHISSSAPNEDTLLITGSLVYLEDQRELASFSATLAVADNLFGCRVTGLEVA